MIILTRGIKFHYLANKNRYKYRTFKVMTIQVLGFLQEGVRRSENSLQTGLLKVSVKVYH